MKEHCYEPIVKVEYGWRVDYNPCRHYNTLYITIDTKELLFNGVVYNRFNIQDINYQNGTIYINVGNRLLSCKLPNASKECAGLMSPLDKQQLDYIFQLLLDGIDSINFSKNVSWGIHLDQNNDKLILVFVNPITSFNDLLSIGETENLVSALVLKPITTLEELRNLRNNDDCFISAKLLKELIEYNNLKDVPEETYLVTLFIGDQLINLQNIVSGGNYEYTYAGLLNGYKLVNSSSLAVSINGNIIKLNNIQQSIEIYLVSQAIEYGISKNGYDSSIWSETGFKNKYTVNDDTFEIEYTLLNPNQYLSSSVKFNGTPITSSENTYTIRIEKGTTGPIEIILSATRKGSAEILTIPEAKQNLIYNGSEQDLLITGGTASNGDMRYVVTANNITTAPSNGWISGIPKRTNAGTYKVWYYAEGKNGYEDSNVDSIDVTIGLATPELTINNPSSTTIADGLNTTINVISNIPGNLTLTTASGTGWSATSNSASTVKSTHIITVTNNSYPNPGSISEGGIRATFTPNNDNYKPLINQSVLNQEITLSPAIYTITWHDNDATTSHEGGSITVNSGDKVILPTEPIRKYSITWNDNIDSGSTWDSSEVIYTFKGWFTDPSGGERIDSNTIPDDNKDYYAQWTAPTSITFPTNPTRSGYTFKGWATSNSATIQNVTEHSVPSTKNETYYAVWEKDIIYYWYVGTITPTDPTNNNENTGLNKWTVLPDSQVSVKIYKEDENLVEHNWYLSAPASRQFVTSVNGTQVGGWRTSTISIDGVEYTVWTTMAEADTVNVTLAKLN